MLFICQFWFCSFDSRTHLAKIHIYSSIVNVSRYSHLNALFFSLSLSQFNVFVAQFIFSCHFRNIFLVWFSARLYNSLHLFMLQLRAHYNYLLNFKNTETEFNRKKRANQRANRKSNSCAVFSFRQYSTKWNHQVSFHWIEITYTPSQFG